MHKNEKGQGLVEYALALALLSIFVFVIIMIVPSCDDENEVRGSNGRCYTLFYLDGMPCFQDRAGSFTCDWDRWDSRDR